MADSNKLEGVVSKMKKLIALVLALVMVLSVTTVFASSPSSDDNKTQVTTKSSSNKATPAAPLMWRIATTEAGNELIEKLNAALEAGDISTVFPEELAVAAGMIVADVISVAVDPKIAEETSYTAEMLNVAGVAKDAKALTLALVDEAWFAGEAKAPADNTVDMTFNADTLKAMAAAANITLVVLVEKAE